MRTVTVIMHVKLGWKTLGESAHFKNQRLDGEDEGKGKSSRISRQSTQEDGNVVRPTHRPSLPPRKYSWYLLLLEVEPTPGP